MDNNHTFLFQGRSIEAVIFDLDGTLYDQTKMQTYMLLKLLKHYILRPHKLYELEILYYFRKKRYEAGGGENIEDAQYQVTADFLRVSKKEVREIVSFWIEEQPLSCMRACLYVCMPEYFKQIHKRGIKISVASDYPVEKKLVALGLTAEAVTCSTDKDINAFKPSPEVFLLAAKKMNIAPEHCLVVGDRDEKDGEAARRAGMLFCHVDKIIQKSNIVTTKEFLSFFSYFQ